MQEMVVLRLRPSIAHWFVVPLVAAAFVLLGLASVAVAETGSPVARLPTGLFLLLGLSLGYLLGTGATLTPTHLRVPVLFRTRSYDLARVVECRPGDHPSQLLNRYVFFWMADESTPVRLYMSSIRRPDAEALQARLLEAAHANAARGLLHAPVQSIAPGRWVSLASLLMAAAVATLATQGRWSQTISLAVLLVWLGFHGLRGAARFDSQSFAHRTWLGQWRTLAIRDLNVVELQGSFPVSLRVTAEHAVARVSIVGGANFIAKTFRDDLAAAMARAAPDAK